MSSLVLRLGAVVVAAYVLGGCATPVYPYAGEPDPRAVEYVLDVPDTIKVRVWGRDELTTESSIRPDGNITLPLIGDIPAAGKTPSELKRLLAGQFRAYVKLDDDSSVSVEVVKIESYRVVVNGRVNSPGVQTPTHFVTVTEAIVGAGGLTRFADPDDVSIVRTRPGGKVVHIPVRYDLVEQGKAMEQDILLLRGDVVYVP